jgi:hypothetical protein
MAKSIKIFKSFEEQERYFLEYFANLTPSEPLQALSKLKNKIIHIQIPTPQNNHDQKAFYL